MWRFSLLHIQLNHVEVLVKRKIILLDVGVVTPLLKGLNTGQGYTAFSTVNVSCFFGQEAIYKVLCLRLQSSKLSADLPVSLYRITFLL